MTKQYGEDIVNHKTLKNEEKKYFVWDKTADGRMTGMDSLKVRIKKMDKNAKIPTRRSSQAAGYDLYADIISESQEIGPGETAKIGTGIAVEIPDGYFGAVFARSGLAAKRD